MVVELGCGYGTFTLPTARLSKDLVIHAFDIEAEMVDLVRSKAARAGLQNVICQVRDFVDQGTGLAEESVDYVMLFNLLHAELPSVLLAEAWRVLRPGGRLGIMHWNYDPSTPRGPSMSIRPRPEQCLAWAETAGFQLLQPGVVKLPLNH